MQLSLSRRREIRPDGSILVVDLSQEPAKALELYPEEKRAVETTVLGKVPANDPDILRRASDAQNRFGEDLGEQEIDGRMARGFRVPEPHNDWTFWIDPETELPIRIELVQTQAGRKLIWSEFEFDVDFDESLFSTTAPEGYTVQKKEIEK